MIQFLDAITSKEFTPTLFTIILIYYVWQIENEGALGSQPQSRAALEGILSQWAVLDVEEEEVDEGVAWSPGGVEEEAEIDVKNVTGEKG